METTLPPQYPPQNADGTPHFAYFISEEHGGPRGGVSFVWTGDYNQPIEMCIGGYGEPATIRVRMSEEYVQFQDAPNLLKILAQFQFICDSIWGSYQVAPEFFKTTDE